MDTLTNAIKVFARNEWIYYYYAKIKSTFQKYIDDSFEANQIIDNFNESDKRELNKIKN